MEGSDWNTSGTYRVDRQDGDALFQKSGGRQIAVK